MKTFALLLLTMMVGSSQAITRIISTGFGVTDLQCFGVTVATFSNDDVQSDFDICLAGAITAAIVFIGLYPLLGREEEHGYGYGYNAYPHKRRDRYPVHFENPANTVQNKIENFIQDQEGAASEISNDLGNHVTWISDRISKAFDEISTQVKHTLTPKKQQRHPKFPQQHQEYQRQEEETQPQQSE